LFQPNSWLLTVGVLEVAVPPLATAKVPLHPGIKVKVLAVVVEMLIAMLVSVVVATWMAGPVKLEIEVKAEVR
jgi:hypothetical protein